jgi:LuxR family maltose regulon positive regulatory protein
VSLHSRPLSGEHLIDRPALLAALDGAFDHRLTLIAAQAGAGKTTLLRQWAASHPDRNFIFLDIDASDDDPAHFARRLTSALAQMRPVGRRTSIAAGANGDGLTLPLIANLTDALERSPETVIVLDDVHRFTNVTLVAGLGRFIEHLPRTAHIVLASRIDPPIALSRYRLNNDLLELRPAQLAFAETESATLLERIVGHPLTPQQVRALRERTEGWAAGLQLAGLHLRNAPDADSFIAEFTGSDRLVADYLGEEVIASLPPERRHLLLEMSALDDMCAGLVKAATGSGNAQKVLEELERENMFLVPLDGRRQWFRFHHLFSELLRSRLRTEDPVGELRILTAAADWHLARGRMRAALDYLLRAQARDGAMEAMLAKAADAAAAGKAVGGRARSRPPLGDVLRSAQINEELLAGIRHAWGDESAAQPAPYAWEQADGSARSRPQRGWGFVAAQVLWRARPDISIATATERLAELERGGAAPVELVEALVSGGRAYFLAGDTDAARKWLVRALHAAAPDVVGRVSALSALSLVEAWRGNAVTADSLLREALETARDAGMLAHPAIADAYLASVLTALEPDRQSPLSQSGADPPAGGSTDGLVASDVPGSTAPSIRHPLIAAHRPLPSLETEYGTTTTPPLDAKLVATVLFERAADSLTAGDLQNARAILGRWDDLVSTVTPLSIVQRHILLARLSAADEAPGEALRELTAALKVAEIHGLVDVFLQAGPLILRRLSMVSGPQAAFSEVIRVRARQSAAATAILLSDPLTERELEILSYLPTRFTNVELARRFFVSVNTIKTHMAHIYRKLDVTTRDSAILRARELGLL